MILLPSKLDRFLRSRPQKHTSGMHLFRTLKFFSQKPSSRRFLNTNFRRSLSNGPQVRRHSISFIVKSTVKINKKAKSSKIHKKHPIIKIYSSYTQHQLHMRFLPMKQEHKNIKFLKGKSREELFPKCSTLTTVHDMTGRQTPLAEYRCVGDL